MDPTTCCAFYFEMASAQASATTAPGGQRLGYVQFQTQYQHSSGQWRLRVTTVCRGFARSPETALGDLSIGYDQECAAVLMARIGVHKAEQENSFDVIRWLDKCLIQLVTKFAQYSKGDPNSLHLAPVCSSVNMVMTIRTLLFSLSSCSILEGHNS